MTGEQRALQAWLAAQTPAGGQPGLTQGAAMLTTPHLQGLLQQLRISTPSLGAQVGSDGHFDGSTCTHTCLRSGISRRLMMYVTMMCQASINFLSSDTVWTSNLH